MPCAQISSSLPPSQGWWHHIKSVQPQQNGKVSTLVQSFGIFKVTKEI